ncbi:hypothetical protein [Hippea alviniae]|uniref:hypothetical protein n=1 Tax=Hippea alviniae TaxID=1279027 RepID=UPI0003B6482C|nr:hypothetical protein [Hippea alviniae]
MFSELVYLAVGIGKRVDRMIDSIIEDGKKELENKGLIDIAKEHLQKRKELVRDMVLEDVKKTAKELGLATKEDIEELKRLIQQNR